MHNPQAVVHFPGYAQQRSDEVAWNSEVPNAANSYFTKN
jgi:hypothetical protein